MRESTRGFTLIELIVAVGAMAVLLVAGGIWLASMHPGALRNAVDDFDADIGAAKAIAASSGNGATIALLPRIDAQGNTHPGFELRVYSGRPTSANAVQPSNVMIIDSDATIAEKTFGSPPFAIFLSSAGHPTGVRAYPTIDARGTVSFGAIATQPPCPAGGIALTFTSPQGATDTRTLQCNVTAVGTAVANPSPTPNAPVVSPTALLAHWTSDTRALHFVAAEFGYTHWFASNTGRMCGSAATYNSPWPYSNPQNASEANIAPNPPNPSSNPYSWPNNGGASMNDAPAPFALSPVPGNPGLCTVDIVDDYGQHAGASVQVMGDLTQNPASLTFASPTAPAQTITFSKTYDTETITLKATTNCGGIASYAQSTTSAPATPSTTPSVSRLTVTPHAGGRCTIRVSDQYGEPFVDIPIVVTSPQLLVWPQYVVYGASGANVAMGPSRSDARNADAYIAKAINALFGGTRAIAAGTCPAIAMKSDMQTPDTSPPAWVNLATIGWYTMTGASPGCFNGDVTANEAGAGVAFTDNDATCQSYVAISSWTPSQYGPIASIATAGQAASNGCSFQIIDQTAQQSLVNAAVTALLQCAVGQNCLIGADIEQDVPCESDPTLGGGNAGAVDVTTPVFLAGAGLGNAWSDGSNYYFTRTGYGTVTIQLTDKGYRQPLVQGPRGGMVCAGQRPFSTVLGTTSFY